MLVRDDDRPVLGIQINAAWLLKDPVRPSYGPPGSDVPMVMNAENGHVGVRFFRFSKLLSPVVGHQYPSFRRIHPNVAGAAEQGLGTGDDCLRPYITCIGSIEDRGTSAAS